MNKNDEARVREFLGIAVGEASMCWSPPPSGQVFDSTRASSLVDRLFSLFAENLEASRVSTLKEVADLFEAERKSCADLGIIKTGAVYSMAIATLHIRFPEMTTNAPTTQGDKNGQ